MDINIKKIALLAKIKVKEEEEEKFKKAIEDIAMEMEKIPKFEDELSLLDENNPMSLRKDEVKSTTNRDDILKNAAKVSAGCVVVPRTVD